MSPLPEELADGRRIWRGNLPASDGQIQELIDSLDGELPSALVDLLKYSNGGGGELNLPPMWFQLHSTAEISEAAGDEFYREQFPDFFFFGSNGSLELIAVDSAFLSVVALDPIAGKDSAVEIAPSLDAFINAIGIEYKNA